jgi:phosphatidylinositol dimannoside acyltransferase
MGNGRAARGAVIAERVAYWTVTAPVLALLPAALGYRIACRRGDRLFRTEAAKRADLTRNLGLVLGNELRPDAAQAAVRDWFRLSSCEAVDVKRLRRKGRSLRRLVEIRGREHLEAALAAGKGALLCSAHFGSFNSAFSLLGASGFKITTIGRWQHKYTAGLSGAERRFWNLVYARPLRRLRYRPNIEPWAGRFEVAAKAAAALRANEVVTISIDVPPLRSDRARAIEVPFLGGRARLLPGVVPLAKITGAPVLMCFLYRSADYCHQVLDISAPVPLDGDTAMAFGRCAAEVSAAITRSPAHWQYLASTADLTDLGLIPPAGGSAVPAAAPRIGAATGLQPAENRPLAG